MVLEGRRRTCPACRRGRGGRCDQHVWDAYVGEPHHRERLRVLQGDARRGAVPRGPGDRAGHRDRAGGARGPAARDRRGARLEVGEARRLREGRARHGLRRGDAGVRRRGVGAALALLPRPDGRGAAGAGTALPGAAGRFLHLHLPVRPLRAGPQGILLREQVQGGGPRAGRRGAHRVPGGHLAPRRLAARGPQLPARLHRGRQRRPGPSRARRGARAGRHRQYGVEARVHAPRVARPG